MEFWEYGNVVYYVNLDTNEVFDTCDSFIGYRSNGKIVFDKNCPFSFYYTSLLGFFYTLSHNIFPLISAHGRLKFLEPLGWAPAPLPRALQVRSDEPPIPPRPSAAADASLASLTWNIQPAS